MCLYLRSCNWKSYMFIYLWMVVCVTTQLWFPSTKWLWWHSDTSLRRSKFWYPST